MIGDGIVLCWNLLKSFNSLLLTGFIAGTLFTKRYGLLQGHLIRQ